MEIRTTVAPIAIEQLREKFENPNILFLIDYSKSALRDNQFITYIGNIGVECNVEVDFNETYETRANLLKAYLDSRITVNIPSLVETLALCLLHIKSLTDSTVPSSIILLPDEIERFVEENRLQLEKFCLIVDSSLLYLLSANESYVKEFGHPREQHINIDDALFVGNNFVHLFKQTAFIETFFSRPGGQYYYFTKQFEDYMFGSKLNLFNHFMVPENPLPIIFSAMLEEPTILEGVAEEIEQMDAYVEQVKAQ